MPYTTKQQQAVLACLSQRREQPLSAMELAEELRREGHAVGLSTIYRQLEKLERAGHIHRVNTEEGALYQYCGRQTCGKDCFLLKCQDCGRILHLDCSQLKPFYDHLEREHHFLIDPRATMFTGICELCAAGRKEASHGEE